MVSLPRHLWYSKMKTPHNFWHGRWGLSIYGVVAYVDNYTHQAGCITFACYGSIGEVFFHEKPIWASDNVNVLIFKDHQPNKYTWIFITSLLDQEKYRFSYGLTAKMDRLKNLRIKLPILEDGYPDWNWIENYVKNTLIPQLPQTAQELFSDDFVPRAVSTKKLTLDTKSWKTFLAKEVFKITLGRPIHKSDLETELWVIGNPYITRTTERNGTEWYIDEEMEEYINTWNAITIWAEWFMAFYQEKDFYNGNKISILRNSELNKYNSVFLATILDKEVGDRFSYWRGAVKWKLENMKIKLPVTSTWSPDWQWMEDYIKGLPYSSSL